MIIYLIQKVLLQRFIRIYRIRMLMCRQAKGRTFDQTKKLKPFQDCRPISFGHTFSLPSTPFLRKRGKPKPQGK
jgi:hypothetical protein